MSTPALPTFAQSTASVFQFQWLRITRGKKLRFGVVAVLLVVIGVLAARYAGTPSEVASTFKSGVRLGFQLMLVMLLPFLFMSGAIAEEVEGRTFVYLASRPTSRAALTAGKFLAGTLAASVLTAVGLLVLYVGCFVTTPAAMGEHFREFARALLATELLVFSYSAICLMWGAIAVEAAGIVSALYLVVVEFAFSFVPVLKLISLNYLASAVSGDRPEPSELFSRFEFVVPGWIATAVIVGVGFLFYGLASLVIRMSEYRASNA